MSVLTPLTNHHDELFSFFLTFEDLSINGTHLRVREQCLHLVTEHFPLKYGQLAWWPAQGTGLTGGTLVPLLGGMLDMW